MTRWALRLVAVVVVALGLYCEKQSDGWGSIVGIFVLWPIAGVMHLAAHSIRLPRSGRIQGSRLALITVSHLLFIAAFLLQYDVGDGPGWLVITQFLGRGGVPNWWPNPFIMNIAVFLPVLATWVLLIRRRRE